MGAESMLKVRNPLQAKLDGVSLVQLTLWVLLVLTAWAIGNWLFTKAKNTAAQATGTMTASGSTNPFFS